MFVGLIAGHRNTKAVAYGGREVVFPSLAASAELADADPTTGMINLNGLGGMWYVGEDAIALAPKRVVQILDHSRYSDPSFIALVRAALNQVVTDTTHPLEIMTGLPAAWFKKDTLKQALEEAITKAARPWGGGKVTIAPESAGVYYDAVFVGGTLQAHLTEGQVGVIDAGYRDAGVALYHNGRQVFSESVPGGIADAIATIRRLIQRDYGVELHPTEVDVAVRRGHLMVEGRQRPLPAETPDAIERALAPVLSLARTSWPNGGRTLNRVVLGGGTAVAWGPALLREFPALQVPRVELDEGMNADAVRAAIERAQPHLSGARGFAVAIRARAAAARAQQRP